MSTYRDDDPSSVFNRKGKSRPVQQPGRGPRDYSVNDDALDELDDFVPPNPPNPLGGAKPGVVIGAVLTIGAILALIVFPFLPVSFPGWTTPALIGVMLFGLLVLFLQMPRNRNPNSGDGAQV